MQQKLHSIETTRARAKKWDVEHAEHIKTKVQELSNMEELDYDHLISVQHELQELKSQRKIIENGINNVTSTVLKDLEKRIDNITNEINSLADSKCPYCSQDFADSKCKHDSLIIEQQELNRKRAQTLFTLSEDNDILIKLDEEILEKSQGSKYSVVELISLKQKRENLERSIENIKKETNPYQVEDDMFLEPDIISENERSINENREKIEKTQKKLVIKNQYDLSELKASLKHYERRYDELQKEQNPHTESILNITSIEVPETKDAILDEMDKLIKHQDFLVKLLTKKDSFIRKNLLQKNLPLLNTRLKIYLQKMGLPHKVTFVENMSTQIKQFDTEMDFNQLSSGQKARINLALSFAFRDVLQYRHGPVNFCMLDECLDTGLSNTGVQLAVKFIKEIAAEQKLALFIISHRDEAASMFDNKLCIEYRNGFSNIV
jgi:hypothetical protein